MLLYLPLLSLEENKQAGFFPSELNVRLSFLQRETKENVKNKTTKRKGAQEQYQIAHTLDNARQSFTKQGSIPSASSSYGWDYIELSAPCHNTEAD